MRPTKTFLFRTLAGLLFFLLLSLDKLGHPTQALAYDEVALPDYEKEARIVFQGTCDQGRVNYTTYWRKGGYILEVALLEAKETFYMKKRYLGEPVGWEQRFFVLVNGSLKLVELSHEEWDEKVRQGSVNYFNKLHDLQSSCSKMIVM
jgi:hypothetical protein